MNEIKRYSPLSILYDFGDFIKNTFFIYLLVYVFNGNSTSWLMITARYAGVVLPVIILLISIAVWFTRKYKIDESTCYVYSGIFNRKTQSIPIHKIQNMNEERNFLHKILRVTTLNFETAASGDDATISFQVISNEESEQIKKHVLSMKAEQTKDDFHEATDQNHLTDEADLSVEKPLNIENEKVIHFQPTIKDTVKASFTSFSFFLIIPIILTIYNRISDFYDFDQFLTSSTKDLWTSPLLIAVGILLFVIFAVLFGIIKTYLQYGKYEIASDHHTIFIKKGVLNETSFSVPKARVQAVNIEQPFMKRILGLAEVQLVTAGGSLLDEGGGALNKLYPFLPKAVAYDLIHTILPSYQVQDHMKSLPKSALRLKLLRPSWLWIGLTVYLVYVRPNIISVIPYSWLWISLILLAMICTSRILQFKQSKYRFEDQFIQVQTGGFSRSLYLSKRSQIIEVTQKRSVIQQKFHVATIGLTNLAQPIRIEMIEDIAEEDAMRFLEWYQKRVHEITIDDKAYE